MVSMMFVVMLCGYSCKSHRLCGILLDSNIYAKLLVHSTKVLTSANQVLLEIILLLIGKYLFPH